MKKALLALVVIASFVACNSENKPAEGPKTDSTVVITDTTKVVTTDTTKAEPATDTTKKEATTDTTKKETETKVEVEKKP